MNFHQSFVMLQLHVCFEHFLNIFDYWFQTKRFTRLLEFIQLYTQNPLEIIFFTIYQSYTLALNIKELKMIWNSTKNQHIIGQHSACIILVLIHWIIVPNTLGLKRIARIFFWGADSLPPPPPPPLSPLLSPSLSLPLPLFFCIFFLGGATAPTAPPPWLRACSGWVLW